LCITTLTIKKNENNNEKPLATVELFFFDVLLNGALMLPCSYNQGTWNSNMSECEALAKIIINNDNQKEIQKEN